MRCNIKKLYRRNYYRLSNQKNCYKHVTLLYTINLYIPTVQKSCFHSFVVICGFFRHAHILNDGRKGQIRKTECRCKNGVMNGKSYTERLMSIASSDEDSVWRRHFNSPLSSAVPTIK